MSEIDPTILAVPTPSEIGHDIVDLAQRALHNTSELISSHPTPAVVAIAGGCALVGAFMEYRAVGKIGRNAEPLSDEWKVLTENATPKRIRRGVRTVASLAAVGGAFVGATNAAIWINTGHAERVAPGLGVVIDKSGGTMLDDQSSAIEIRGLANEINEELTDYETTAFIASSSTVETTALAAADGKRPFGDAPMGEAFSLSLDGALGRRSEVSAGDELPSTAIVILTNGNGVAGVASKEKIEFADSPVFIFDASEGTADSASLKDLAEETGGMYFDKEAVDTQEEVQAALDTIKESTEPTEKDTDSRIDLKLRIAISTLSGLSYLAWRKIRPHLTTRFNIPDDTKFRTKLKNNTIGRLPIIGKKVRS
jgi:hypothetical protein